MLVLSRHAGQSVMIGHDVVVTVLEVRGDVVRIGISAPRDVDVHREEVFLELRAANVSAATVPEGALDAVRRLLPPPPEGAAGQPAPRPQPRPDRRPRPRG